MFLLLIYWFLINDYLSSIFILGNCDAISVFLNCIITSFCFLSFLIYFSQYFFFFYYFYDQSIVFILMFVHTRERGSSPGFVGVYKSFIIIIIKIAISTLFLRRQADNERYNER